MKLSEIRAIRKSIENEIKGLPNKLEVLTKMQGMLAQKQIKNMEVYLSILCYIKNKLSRV